MFVALQGMVVSSDVAILLGGLLSCVQFIIIKPSGPFDHLKENATKAKIPFYGRSYTVIAQIHKMMVLLGMVDGLGSQLLQRRQLYAGPMSKLRLLMISRMAKPEEILIVEDENGNIVRETMKDNDIRYLKIILD
ncbi:Exportin-1, repeat 2 [Dillenia turbinata]|uniref:Exportin-1, repeat 2 n=1 Tax=Dillenia turbinata TaxID=194707 RepID=A0AAN8UPW8_9MAGN